MDLYAVFIRRPRYFRAFQCIHRKRESKHRVTGRKTLRSQLINSSRPRHENERGSRSVLDKFWPPQTHSGMSRRHEQKHLLHNWSDCRYRDRPQTPRAVLRVGVASGSQRLIPTGERCGLQTRIATTENVSLCTRRKS
jgi:hypothetical protein